MLNPLSVAARRIAEILKRRNAGKALAAADKRFVEKVLEANSPGRPRDDAKLPVYSSMAEAASRTGIPLPLLRQAKKRRCVFNEKRRSKKEGSVS